MSLANVDWSKLEAAVQRTRDSVNAAQARDAEQGREPPEWKPSARIQNANNGQTVIVDLPGLGTEDVSISRSPDNASLIVRYAGSDSSATDKTGRTVSKPTAAFELPIPVPAYLPDSAITWEMTNGQLIITISKAEREIRPKG